MKKIHYNEKTGRILGFYDTMIHTTLPSPVIDISDVLWSKAVKEGHNVVDTKTSTTSRVDFQSESQRLEYVKEQASISLRTILKKSKYYDALKMDKKNRGIEGVTETWYAAKEQWAIKIISAMEQGLDSENIDDLDMYSEDAIRYNHLSLALGIQDRNPNMAYARLIINYGKTARHNLAVLGNNYKRLLSSIRDSATVTEVNKLVADASLELKLNFR